MPIVFHLDTMLRQRKMHLDDVAKATGINMVRLRRMESGMAKEINLAVLERLCEVFDCQPADLIEHVDSEGGICNAG